MDCGASDQITTQDMEKCNIDKSSPKRRVSSGASLLMPHLKTYCPASNLALNEHVNKLIADGQKVYHFAFGQSPFPVMQSARKSLGEHAAQNAYLPVAGKICYKSNIIDWIYSYKNSKLVKMVFDEVDEICFSFDAI